MKIILLSATEAALPALDWLFRQGHFLTLLCPAAPEQAGMAALEAWAEAQGLPCWQVSAESLEGELDELLHETVPDLVLLHGFPYHVSPALFDRYAGHAWNIHFALHPMDDDSDRIKGTVTLHEWKSNGERVLQQLPVIMGSQEPDPIGRLSALTVPLLAQALQAPGSGRSHGFAAPGIAAIF